MKIRARAEGGFTLVELLITIVITTMITGAMSTAFITALHGSQSTGQRIRESNDAQLIATYLTRDAQAAGGTDPSTNTPDSSLGVSLTDSAGCTSPTGTLVVRFKWIDWSSATAGIARVATYSYDSGAGQLLRRTCNTSGGTTTTSSFTLGNHIGSTPAAPTASCVPASDCPGTPDEVRLTLSELNNPQNAPSPYTYTLSASLRPQAGTAPTGSNATTVPFLLLGGTNCASGPDMTSQGGGASSVRVYGPAFLNGNDPACEIAHFQGSPDYDAANGTFAIGTCSNIVCSPLGSPIPDPFSKLPFPPGTTASGSCPAGGTNPGLDGSGNYVPGIYPTAVTINSTKVLGSGTYIFCNGLTVNGTVTSAAGGVFLYFAGGSLSVGGSMRVAAQSTGAYARIAVWQRAADGVTMNFGTSNGVVAHFDGTIYAPGATVSIFKADFWARALIARAVAWPHGGNNTTQIGGDENPAPRITGPGALTTPWTKGEPYPGAQMTATGGAGGDTWSATGLPNGLTIDASTGKISGTPTSTGTFSVTVKITDVFGMTDTQPYTVKINAAPAISGSLPSWTVNRAYSASLSATGGTAPLTWSATGLPNGLSINSSSGAVSGTPTTTGSFSPKITVTDSAGAADVNTYSVTINGAPSITTTSLPAAGQGSAYSATVVGADGTTDYSWSATGLPAGLGIDPSTGEISGTPTGSGTASVTVKLTDAAGATASKSFGLTVSVVPPTVTSVVLGNANGQVAKSDTITVTFSKAIAVTSLCGNWSAGNTSLSGNNDVVVHVNNGTGGANDTVTVTSSACPTLHFGTLDLGSPNVVTSNLAFSGNGGNKSSVSYNTSTFVLTVTLGSGSSGASGIAAQTISYTPSPAVTDTSGNAISGSYSFAGRRF